MQGYLWKIRRMWVGEVCTWKGNGKFAGVKNDCPTAESAGRFFPARLTIDLNTTQALIFGTMVVRFRR
jgi:hypothetical protein